MFAGVPLPTLAEKASCLELSKGDYAGNITTKEECRTACEVAEGFPEPDFKTSECDEGTNYECQCKKCDSSNSNCQYRDLCEDEVCSSAGSGGTVIGVATTISVLTSLLFLLD